MPRLALFVTLVLALAGCATQSSTVQTGGTSGGDPMQRPEIVERDVIVDGVSLLGVWKAIGALDEPEVDDDLRRGLMTETLVVNPRGRAVLSGEDDRAAAGHLSYEGQISGNLLAFRDLDGAARLNVRSDGRLIVTDPLGRRTVYERE